MAAVLALALAVSLTVTIDCKHATDPALEPIRKRATDPAPEPIPGPARAGSAKPAGSVMPRKPIAKLHTSIHAAWQSRRIESLSFLGDGRLMVQLDRSELVLFSVSADGSVAAAGGLSLSDPAIKTALGQSLHPGFAGDPTLGAAIGVAAGALIAIDSGPVGPLGALVRIEWNADGKATFTGFVSTEPYNMTGPAKLCASGSTAALANSRAVHMFDIAGPIERTGRAAFPDAHDARDVACHGQRVAVARGDRGVDIYELAGAAGLALTQTIAPKSKPVTQFGQFRSGGPGTALRVWWSSTGLIVGEHNLIRWQPHTDAEDELRADYVRAAAANGVLALEQPGKLTLYASAPPLELLGSIALDLDDFTTAIAVDGTRQRVALITAQGRLLIFKY